MTGRGWAGARRTRTTLFVALVVEIVAACGTAEEARLTTWSRVVDHEPTTVIPHMIAVGTSGVEIAVQDGDGYRTVVAPRPNTTVYAVGDEALLLVSRERDMLRRASLVGKDGVERALERSLGGDFFPAPDGASVLRVETVVTDDATEVGVTRLALDGREAPAFTTRVPHTGPAERVCTFTLLVGVERDAPHRLVLACQTHLAFVDAHGALVRPAADVPRDSFVVLDGTGIPREESLWWASSEAAAALGRAVPHD